MLLSVLCAERCSDSNIQSHSEVISVVKGFKWGRYRNTIVSQLDRLVSTSALKWTKENNNPN